MHALGDSCPKAKGIIHLGMTSQDVVCNADSQILEQSIWIIHHKLARIIILLGDWSMRWRTTPTLAFTHYQPAQPMTVGRRGAQWTFDLLQTMWRVCSLDDFTPFRGLKGATGTQASFLSLCMDDPAQVDRLEHRTVGYWEPARCSRWL